MCEVVLYFVHDDLGHVRIGSTSSLSARLNNIRPGNPYRLELACVVWISNGRAGDVEMKIHGLLVDCRVRGKWYRRDGLDYVELVYRAAGMVEADRLEQNSRATVHAREGGGVRMLVDVMMEELGDMRECVVERIEFPVGN